MLRVNGCEAAWSLDEVAVEEPLEIRLGCGDSPRIYSSISVTMRTPGHDRELAAGFLFTERVVQSASDLESIEPWGGLDENGFRNIVKVNLRPGLSIDARRLERHFYTTSSCGVCGKAGLDSIRVDTERLAVAETIPRNLVHQLPQRLRAAQEGFAHTGGLHATALFDSAGQIIVMREDVGRHNAMDKAIGHTVLNSSDSPAVALVSGRASFELIQKVAVARIPVLAAVGAPSSLALRLADECGVTLIGFLRDARFNVYTHPGRIGGLAC